MLFSPLDKSVDMLEEIMSCPQLLASGQKKKANYCLTFTKNLPSGGRTGNFNNRILPSNIRVGASILYHFCGVPLDSINAT